MAPASRLDDPVGRPSERPKSRLAALAERNGGRWVLAALAVAVLVGLGLRIGYAAAGRDYQPPDSVAYARIAANIHRDGSFEAYGPGVRREVQPASGYAPGLPFVVAAVYELAGGVDLTLARIVLSLFAGASVLLAYLLGRRLSGPVAGLIAAWALAIYPALLEYQGLLLTEPLASFLLAAGLLAFFAALERSTLWPWVGAGALFGALAMVRPEYLLVAIALPLVALAVAGRRTSARDRVLPSLAMLLAAVVVLAPWTVRNVIVLDRVVPVSTGVGKTLYIGTSLSADGDGVKLLDQILDRHPELRQRLRRGGPVHDPHRLVLERLLARIAAREYPGVDLDVALGRLGRRQLGYDVSEHPAEFASLLATKAYRTWTTPARGIMESPPWRALQVGLLLFALLGLGLLAAARRFEALVLGLILLYVTAVGALLIASPRRELVVLPVIAALAGAGIAWLVEEARRRWAGADRGAANRTTTAATANGGRGY
jgi:4-amino-4-deoxy-L-arabinose transferase-like glycosyltransferase